MNIVKIGGGRTIDTDQILMDIKVLSEPTIIVHGANTYRDELAARLGVPIRRIVSETGQSSVYSDAELMDLQLMSYAGLRNKRIVEKAQALGLNAIGLTGIDGGLVRARSNRGIRVREDGRRRLIHDLSGKPLKINRSLLEHLLSEQYLPVITIPFLDEQGRAVNSENDDLVALLHQELGSRRIFFCIEAPGLLRQVHGEDILIPQLSSDQLNGEMARLEGRIKRKLLALQRIVSSHATTVHVCDGRIKNPLMTAIKGGGTCLTT